MGDSEVTYGYCWMWEYCPYRAAPCRVLQPEDDGCYVYRRFKEIFRKQGLLKEETDEKNVKLKP